MNAMVIEMEQSARQVIQQRKMVTGNGKIKRRPVMIPIVHKRNKTSAQPDQAPRKSASGHQPTFSSEKVQDAPSHLNLLRRAKELIVRYIGLERCSPKGL